MKISKPVLLAIFSLSAQSVFADTKVNSVWLFEAMSRGNSCRYECYLEYRDCLAVGGTNVECTVERTLCESHCRHSIEK